jgi:hypothetical protein
MLYSVQSSENLIQLRDHVMQYGIAPHDIKITARLDILGTAHYKLCLVSYTAKPRTFLGDNDRTRRDVKPSDVRAE